MWDFYECDVFMNLLIDVEELAMKHKVGNVYKIEENLYILSRTNVDSICFISLADGNRWIPQSKYPIVVVLRRKK